MSSKQTLQKFMKNNFKDSVFVLASNREPFSHVYDKKSKKIKTIDSVGGVSVTFDSVMKSTNGIWVAYGSASADKKAVDKFDHVQVPENDPKYTLRRIWMNKEEEKGYYDGFSNEALWPLCHTVFIEPTFRSSDWNYYKKINKRFADAILEEIKGKKAVVWIQDYQLALVAKYLKKSRPDIFVGQFWHIPWPAYEIFRICPWKEELLSALLCNDLLGFHRFYHVDNFLKNVSRELEAKINYEDSTVDYKNKKTKVGFFPIGIDNENIKNYLSNNDADAKEIIKNYIKTDYSILAVGADRVDYTKGLVNRLLGIEDFLLKNPKYHGKFVYLGIGSPSRTSINAYRKLNSDINKLVSRINNKFSTKKWQPIYYYNQTVKRKDLLKIFSVADLCLVTPFDDGMNLVSKEYVMANNGNGALVLSYFAGASKELDESYFVNPYDYEEISRVIKKAISDPDKIKNQKMENMKAIIKNNNVFGWAEKFLAELAGLNK